jgi:hypothetical protein
MNQSKMHKVIGGIIQDECPNSADLAERRFSRLSVLHKVGRKGGHPVWLCLCDCGKVSVCSSTALVSGQTTSCGCFQRQRCSEANGTHRGRGTCEYAIYKSMLNRCSNPNAEGYGYYGGRGIRVCDRWRSGFATFLEDMGKKPTPRHSIDRINVDGNYEPGNCRWATPKEQGANRRNTKMVTAFGRTQNIQSWADEYGMHWATLNHRISYGWNPELALTTPVKRPNAGAA